MEMKIFYEIIVLLGRREIGCRQEGDVRKQHHAHQAGGENSFIFHIKEPTFSQASLKAGRERGSTSSRRWLRGRIIFALFIVGESTSSRRWLRHSFIIFSAA